MHYGLLTEGCYQGSNRNGCKFVARCNSLNLLSGLKMQPGNQQSVFQWHHGNPSEKPLKQNYCCFSLLLWCNCFTSFLLETSFGIVTMKVKLHNEILIKASYQYLVDGLLLPLPLPLTLPLLRKCWNWKF